MAAATVSNTCAWSRMRSAPDAATQARGLGQPSRGLTKRKAERPKLAMARAAAPTLSPSCGSTRMPIGPGSAIQALVLSVPAPGIAPPETVLRPPRPLGGRPPDSGPQATGKDGGFLPRRDAIAAPVGAGIGEKRTPQVPVPDLQATRGSKAFFIAKLKLPHPFPTLPPAPHTPDHLL